MLGLNGTKHIKPELGSDMYSSIHFHLLLCRLLYLHIFIPSTTISSSFFVLHHLPYVLPPHLSSFFLSFSVFSSTTISFSITNSCKLQPLQNQQKESRILRFKQHVIQRQQNKLGNYALKYGPHIWKCLHHQALCLLRYGNMWFTLLYMTACRWDVHVHKGKSSESLNNLNPC